MRRGIGRAPGPSPSGGVAMKRRARLLAVLATVAVVAAVAWYLGHDRRPPHYTGFVEGEERIVRSEVTGRVLEVAYAEGAAVPADAILARLDPQDVESRIRSKQQEVSVLDASIAAQDERVRLVQTTWERDVSAHRAE